MRSSSRLLYYAPVHVSWPRSVHLSRLVLSFLCGPPSRSAERSLPVHPPTHETARSRSFPRRLTPCMYITTSGGPSPWTHPALALFSPTLPSVHLFPYFLRRPRSPLSLPPPTRALSRDLLPPTLLRSVLSISPFPSPFLSASTAPLSPFPLVRRRLRRQHRRSEPVSQALRGLSFVRSYYTCLCLSTEAGTKASTRAGPSRTVDMPRFSLLAAYAAVLFHVGVVASTFRRGPVPRERVRTHERPAATARTTSFILSLLPAMPPRVAREPVAVAPFCSLRDRAGEPGKYRQRESG